MTLTKTDLRASLGDLNFAMLVWLTFNAPMLHQMDYSRFVQEWYKNGHLSAMFKSNTVDALSDSKVLSRMKQARKVTFLAAD